MSLKRKARKRLYAKQLAPSVALPHVVAVKLGAALSQRWYENITEVTRSAAIAGRHVEKCVENRKKRGSTTVDAHTHLRTHDRTHTHTDKSSYNVFSRKDEQIEREAHGGREIRIGIFRTANYRLSHWRKWREYSWGET